MMGDRISEIGMLLSLTSSRNWITQHRLGLVSGVCAAVRVISGPSASSMPFSGSVEKLAE